MPSLSTSSTPLSCTLTGNLLLSNKVLIPVQAADLIVNTLKAISNSRPLMAQAFLELAVLVLQFGEVERVIYRLGDWSRTADPSLMRHFIFKALEACAPPYSAYFASFLLTYAPDPTSGSLVSLTAAQTFMVIVVAGYQSRHGDMDRS